MPSENMLAELSDTMEKFVTTGFQIAKKRLYTPTSEGGIGLFNLKTFLIALQSTMVKRAFDCCAVTTTGNLTESVALNIVFLMWGKIKQILAKHYAGLQKVFEPLRKTLQR